MLVNTKDSFESIENEFNKPVQRRFAQLIDGTGTKRPASVNHSDDDDDIQWYKSESKSRNHLFYFFNDC